MSAPAPAAAGSTAPAPEPQGPTTPGHEEARRLGCRCPSWINGYGYGARTGPGRIESGDWLVHPDCKLHAPL